jgi:hypothetical protein
MTKEAAQRFEEQMFQQAVEESLRMVETNLAFLQYLW